MIILWNVCNNNQHWKGERETKNLEKPVTFYNFKDTTSRTLDQIQRRKWKKKQFLKKNHNINDISKNILRYNFTIFIFYHHVTQPYCEYPEHTKLLFQYLLEKKCVFFFFFCVILHWNIGNEIKYFPYIHWLTKLVLSLALCVLYLVFLTSPFTCDLIVSKNWLPSVCVFFFSNAFFFFFKNSHIPLLS